MIEKKRSQTYFTDASRRNWQEQPFALFIMTCTIFKGLIDNSWEQDGSAVSRRILRGILETCISLSWTRCSVKQNWLRESQRNYNSKTSLIQNHQKRVWHLCHVCRLLVQLQRQRTKTLEIQTLVMYLRFTYKRAASLRHSLSREPLPPPGHFLSAPPNLNFRCHDCGSCNAMIKSDVFCHPPTQDRNLRLEGQWHATPYVWCYVDIWPLLYNNQ